MTIRSIIIGLLVALFIATYGYINDAIMCLTYIVGNHLPISVFGLIIILAIAINPILYCIRPSWRFSPGELATIMILSLMACSIPGSSTMRILSEAVVLPAKYNNTESGWKDKNILGYVPPQMLVADGKYDKAVIDQFEQGKPEKGKFLGFNWNSSADWLHKLQFTGFSDFPFAQWSKPLMVWLPMILLCSIAIICLSLIVHRQWSSHERLRYPIAQFAGALMEQDEDKSMGSVFRNKLFWIGLGTAFIIYVINGYYVWNPDSIQIPLNADLKSIPSKYPKLWQGGGCGFLFTPKIYLAVMGFAFLLSAEVSFSLGVSQILYVLLTAWLVSNYSFDTSGDDMRGGNMQWQRFGSYLGLAIMLLYIGRRYYWDVFKSAITFRPSARGVEPYAIWACRVFILAIAAMVIILAYLGLNWPFALILILLIMMLFLVIARVNAESGLFFIQPGWMPICALVGLFGVFALGPKVLIVSALVCVILCLDPRESLMPFVINALKIGEQQKLKPKAVGSLGTGVFALVLVAGTAATLWAVYSFGYPKWDTFTADVAKRSFTLGLWGVTDLKQQDTLPQSEQLSTWQRFTSPNPSYKFLGAAGIGLGLVLLTSLLRLRFTWWPLHPILFLIWGTWPMMEFSHSFLAGWLINLAVTRFGGSKGYRTVRALMFGIIAGHLLAGLAFMAHGAAYYLLTDGLKPKLFRVFPG